MVVWYREGAKRQKEELREGERELKRNTAGYIKETERQVEKRNGGKERTTERQKGRGAQKSVKT